LYWHDVFITPDRLASLQTH
jgi:tubulin polyglutamylase TTLL6/13